jgi:hypothetical protein
MKRLVWICGVLLAALAGGADGLSGKWNMSMETPGGERTAVPSFVLDGETVTGKWDSADVKGTLKEGKLELEFPLTSSEAGFQATFKVSAKLEGGLLNGTWSWATYGGKLTGKKQ